MALPTSRDTTYAASVQVQSADLNNIQDKIIDAWNGKHGDKKLAVGMDGSTGQITLGGAADGRTLHLHEGDQIKSFQSAYDRNATVMTFELRYIDLTDGSDNSHANIFTDSASSGWQDRDDAVVHTLLADRIYYVRLGVSADSPVGDIAGLVVTYDHP